MTKLTEQFEQALVYATRLHAQQTRKVTGVPYISHLLSVAALVLEDGGIRMKRSHPYYTTQ